MLLDVGVRVSDGSTVVGDDVGDLVLAHSLSLDGAELEGSFLGIDLVSLVATLSIEQDSEVLTSLLEGDDVHNAKRETGVSSDFVVNLDQAFLVSDNLDGLLTGEGVSQSVSEEDGKGNAFSSLVGTSTASGSVNTTELVQHPVGGSSHSLLMLLGTSCLRSHRQITTI